MTRSKSPYEGAIAVFAAYLPSEGCADYPAQAMIAVKAAVRVAMISERWRCIDICNKSMAEYELESNTSGALQDSYIRGYKDGAEDCIEEMKSVDAAELAEHDAAVAKIAFEDKKKPSPYLIDILAEDEGRVENEGEEKVVWVE